MKNESLSGHTTPSFFFTTKISKGSFYLGMMQIGVKKIGEACLMQKEEKLVWCRNRRRLFDAKNRRNLFDAEIGETCLVQKIGGTCLVQKIGEACLMQKEKKLV